MVMIECKADKIQENMRRLPSLERRSEVPRHLLHLQTAGKDARAGNTCMRNYLVNMKQFTAVLAVSRGGNIWKTLQRYAGESFA